jgi:hypothetical protein
VHIVCAEKEARDTPYTHARHTTPQTNKKQTNPQQKNKAAWWLPEPAKAQYAATVLAPEAALLASGVRGPGLACLERLAAELYPDSPWFVGEALSIADFAAFDVYDAHLAGPPPFAAAARANFPRLARHHALVAADEGVCLCLCVCVCLGRVLVFLLPAPSQTNPNKHKKKTKKASPSTLPAPRAQSS